MNRRRGLRRAARLLPGLAALAGWVGVSGAFAVDLQGHRGARGLRPENTLAAFTAALEIGVTTLEMDAAVTADGIVVVSHDPRLNPDVARGPDGRWVDGPGPTIVSLPQFEVSRYDVGRLRPGSDYAARFPAQQPVDGAKIPSLAAVYGLAHRLGATEVGFNVEVKTDPRRPGDTLDPEAFADAVAGVVRRVGDAARTTIQSFDWRALRRVQRVAPEIRTSYLTAEQPWLDNVERGRPGRSPWLDGRDVDEHGGSIPRLVKAAGGAIWSPFHGDLDRASLDEAHRLGLQVVVWTVNDPGTMRELIAMGVDGIMSDYPDRLRAVAKQMGLPLPPPAK